VLRPAALTAQTPIASRVAIADGEVTPQDGEPTVVVSMDEFGPLNLQPHPGRQWAERGGKHKDPHRDPRIR
jgi:hypothetical protein